MARKGEAVRAAAGLLRAGKIVALKGLGGFQLLVRADDSAAVARLRRRKDRPSKPLAVMAPSFDFAARLARIDHAARRVLASPENPIVLLDPAVGAERFLAPEIAPRLGNVGLLLPTTPLHQLLLGELGLAVVATSGTTSPHQVHRQLALDLGLGDDLDDLVADDGRVNCPAAA